jgi:hypothetical protein
MEPNMSCPQGLTLSGKMCTIAPILSCPTGYTLVNGMCQEDSGVQGFGESMNIPPSVNSQLQLSLGEVAPSSQQPVPVTEPMAVAAQSPQPNTVSIKMGGMIPKLPGEELISTMMQPMRSPNAPQIQPLASPMPMRTISPQRRQQMMMMSPPPPMRSPRPPPVRPSSPSGQCPAGYDFNRGDAMCYPL